jgi:predicted ATP-dependent endonuclease of OLD family
MADDNLYLIEEPENDIHPESLKTLLSAIVEKSENNQFIVSTHSNIVTRYLGAASDCKIFEFTTDHVPNIIPTSNVSEVPPTADARINVLRRLGYELSDFDLWEGWLILEESSAEVIIKYLIPWFAPRLARIRTVAAGGTSKVGPTFEDYRRLFLFAHLQPQYQGRAWVVVDGDDEGKQVATDLQQKYKSWPAEHFSTWSQSDFELYYPIRFSKQIEDTLALPHDKKKAAKKKLLDDVKDWCDNNQDDAKIEFKKSAKEVIAKLQKIEKTL